MDWCRSNYDEWLPGEKRCLVGELKYHTDDWTVLRESLTKGLFATPRMTCPLDRKVTLYDVSKEDRRIDGAWCLGWTETSSIRLMRHDGTRGERVLDIAAGLGGFTMGTGFLGLRTIVANDINPIMAKAFSEVNGSPVITGDIADMVTVKHLHEIQGEISSIFCLGFPCQPLSKQGDRLGSKDSRSKVLPSALWAAHLLQAWMVVLENVPEAAHDGDVQSLLNNFASSHGMIMVQQVLHLQHVWPCRRSWWFAVLYPQEYGMVTIREMPKVNSELTISHVIPTIPRWADFEEEELRWDEKESQMYTDPSLTQGDRDWMQQRQLPTALHSWGSALRACPCGCRANGFSLQRLQKQGLRGLKVQSAHPEAFSRHPHPCEVGILMGIPPFAKLLGSMRLELSLIGNMVSPIQVLWLFAELERVGLVRGTHLGSTEPVNTMTRFLDMLMWQKNVAWPTTDWDKQPSSEVCQLKDQQGVKQVLFEHGKLIRELKEAELTEAPVGHLIKILVDGIEVPDHVLLQQRQYEVLVYPKKQINMSEDLLMVEFDFGSHKETHLIPFGFTLADIFLHADRPLLFRCFDSKNGQLIGWQQKLLSNTSVVMIPLFRAQGEEDEGEEEDEFPFELEDGDEWMESCSDDFRQIIDKVAEALREADTCSSRYISGGGIDSQTMEIASKSIVGMLDQHRQNNIGLISPTLVKDFLGSERHVIKEAIARLIREEGVREFLVVGAFNNHWQVLHLRWSEKELFVVVADAREAMMTRILEQFLAPFLLALGLEKLTISKDNLLLQKPDKICGALALVHAAYLLGLMATANYEEVSDWYLSLRWRDGQPFRAQGSEADEVSNWLLGFLPDKGVPPQRLQGRVKEAMQSLPLQELMKAKQSNNPWRILKGILDKKGKIFRWVQQDELQAHIDEKAQSGYGVAGLKKPSQSRQKDEPESHTPTVDPSTVYLKAGCFVDSKGADVPILEIEQIKVNARGVALANLTDIRAWLFSGKSISLSALALVTPCVIPDDLQGCLPHTCIRYPVLLRASGDPMLLTGSLIQLGDDIVSKKSTMGAPVIATTPTATLKLHVYRDEWQGDWQLFCNKPLGQLQEVFPQLTSCSGKACGIDCKKWHQDLDGTNESPILDVWSWFWQRKEGGKARAKDSFLFTVMLRVPADHSGCLQSLSGREGLYVEPRDPSGRQTDPRFAVIWLGKCEKGEAMVHVQSSEKVKALCRLKDRFGLRVIAEDEGEIYATLFPNRIFVPCKPTDIYVMEPLPIGTQKFGVAKLIKAMNWAAKPMQPKGSSSGSLAWLVAAQNPPNENVVLTDSGEVMITWLRSLAPKRKEVDNVIASWETKKKLQEAPDPWVNGNDPWARYRTPTPAVLPVQQPIRIDQDDSVKSKFEELQAEMKQQIVKQIQESLPTALQEQTERMEKMEVDMQELRLQGEQFNDWFKGQSEIQLRQSRQVEELRESQEQQHSCLQQIMMNLQTCNQELQAHRTDRVTLQQTLVDFQHTMKEEFRAQADRVDKHILGKSPRRE